MVDKSVKEKDSNQADTLKYCILALGRIASGDPTQAQDIVKQNGIITLILALSFVDPNVISSSLSALVSFAKYPENIKELLDNDCVTNLMKCFEEEKLKNPAICEEAISLISCLSSDENAAKQIIEKGGIEKILAAMKLHPNNKIIAEQV